MSAEAITLLIAFWGAITGTLAIAWDGFKWWADAPKLRLTASPNMQMVSGKELLPQQYITLKVVNFGRQQTKLTHLVGYTYKSFFYKLIRRPEQPFIVPGNEFAVLPAMLSPGDEWIGLIAQTQVAELAKEKVLYVGVVDTVSNGTTLVKVDTKKFRDTYSNKDESTVMRGNHE